MNNTPTQLLADDTALAAKYTHQCLIAAPTMDDPFFARAVIYIVQHDQYGAMGFVINQQSDLNLNVLFEQLHIKSKYGTGDSVLNGGPVQPEVGFVLHKGQPFWASSFLIGDDCCVTTSKDILQAIAKNEGVHQFEMLLGYAGWVPGQLEAEIARGDWFCCDSDPYLLFDAPYQDRWDIAINRVGINTDWLATEVGHA